MREFRRSLSLAYRDALRIPESRWSALRGFRDGVAGAYAATAEPVMILGGFVTHPYRYAPLGRLLRELGHEVHFDRACKTRAFAAHVAALRTRIEEIADPSGQATRIIGHSLGGIHGMALLDARPDLVGQVIALGSPVQGGTPWRALQRLAERVLRLDGREAQRLRRRVARHADRITTISAPHDMIAPPASCRVPGATNHVLGAAGPEDGAVASHGGLVFIRASLRLVLSALAEPIATTVAVRDAG